MKLHREILFRGKSFETGEWVVGSLINRHITQITRLIDEVIEVDPVTIGQFTGFTDINGVKIFEGDVLKRIDTENTLFVVWNKDCWLVRTIYDSWTNENVIKRNINVSLSFIITFKIEKINNIHDNPEALSQSCT